MKIASSKLIQLFLKGEKKIVNQIVSSKLWYRGQIYAIANYIKKATEKRIYNFL